MNPLLLVTSLAALGADAFLQQHRGHWDGSAFANSPLPMHLLDLNHKDGTYSPFFSWDLCNTHVHSNLGGLGPDTGAKELRFGQIGEFNGMSIDLLVVNTSTYVVNDIYRNTARGCFGVINVAKNSFVDLTFSFVESGGYAPVEIGKIFYISMFDLDCSDTGCEQLTMMTDVDNFFIDKDSELVLQSSGAGMTFSASTFGVGADNPPPLEALQKARTVTFEMSQPSASFDMTYQVQNSKIGRNFLIGGKTFIVPKKGTTTTTTLTGVPKCYECVVWGDPHIITFDVSKRRQAQHPRREAFFRTRGWKSDQLSIYDAGTFWLVNSERVLIQGRYWHNMSHVEWTNLGALAIGGPFLNGNTLIIRPLAAPSTWNGNEILSMLPSKFENELVHASFSHESEIVASGRPGAGIDIELPEGVRLTVNRWKNSLAVKINMCPQEGGQDGQCGNYNGISNDDIEDIALNPSAQRVEKAKFLF